jgi:hypothetical protein
MRQLQLIDSNLTHSFQIKVTQKILHSQELTFLRTHIQNQDFLLSELSYFCFYFHPPSLSYDIVLYEKVDQNSIPMVFLCKSYIEKKLPNSQSVVFLFEKHFCFYYQQNLVTLKKINNASSEDIQSYIEQAYKVKVDSFVPLGYGELEKYQKEYQKKFLAQDQKTTFQVIKQKSFLYFQYFTVVATIVLLFLLYNIYDNSKQKQQNSQNIQTLSQSKFKNPIQEQYQYFQDKKPIKKMLTFLSDMEKNKIKIKQLKYEKGDFTAIVFDQKKQNLLQLLQSNVSYVDMENISYTKQNNLYTMELQF